MAIRGGLTMVRDTAKHAALYVEDETAWLETMAQLAAERRADEVDWHNLSEYLFDMARRDRREVYSRLVVLLAHWLKWDLAPDQRTNSWRATIMTQSRDLRLLLESGTLRRHALGVLDQAYQEARHQAAVESDLSVERFPRECPFTMDQMLMPPWAGETE
jgi:hypothetical protein